MTVKIGPEGWLGIIPWLMGIVWVTGFWLTVLAVVFPPYAWYVAAEHLMRLSGIL